MVTSFADGTKVSVEQALVANAAGLSVHQRGCLQRDHRGHVDELTGMYDIDELKELGGAVDYVVGSQPGPASTSSPRTRTPSSVTTSTSTSWGGAAVQLLHALPPLPL